MRRASNHASENQLMYGARRIRWFTVLVGSIL